ncbi:MULTISPECIES: alpha/beta hydrolase [Streptomyces]|uniref:alpha/beta hydrolase n=1 Tax=Streptomyces TaxID=1883 RepID=UPI002E3501FF|nr:alpha/beta hydrolase [Streptomyces canus]WSZ34870.1 alpha/beta hydrolase [Streptomyces sp. NBC_00882]
MSPSSPDYVAPDPLKPVPVKPDLLLVHGAWFGSWCWDPITEPLRERGFTVHTVDLPSVGAAGPRGDLYDDIAAVEAALARIAGPVVLCGHSYGGLPVSEAAAGSSNVVALLYICAFVLPAGVSPLAALGGEPMPWWVPSTDGTSMTPADPARLFFNACPPETAERAARRLVPISTAPVGQPLRKAGWLSTPSGYVVCTQDNSLPEPVQQTMAEVLTRTYTLDADHAPFLSRPDELAATLDAAVAELTSLARA